MNEDTKALHDDLKALTHAINSGNQKLPGSVVTLSKFMGEIKRHIKDTKDTIAGFNVTLQNHNGRLTKMEMLHERLKGAKMATRTVWGVLSVFVVASTFGLFNMYVAFQQLPYVIDQAIDKALEDKTFEYDEN